MLSLTVLWVIDYLVYRDSKRSEEAGDLNLFQLKILYVIVLLCVSLTFVDKYLLSGAQIDVLYKLFETHVVVLIML